MNYNKVILAGRLVRDPEMKTTANGINITSITIATTRTWTHNGEKKEQTEFHSAIAFGKIAEVISQYVNKGQLILISGRLQTRNWEKDGQKRYKTEIIVEEMQLGQKSGSSTGKQTTINTPEPIKTQQVDEDEITIEDIPF